MSIPIVIHIYINDGETHYKAYSPNNYNNNSQEDGLAAFLDSLYNHINYDSAHPLNAQTSLGELKEEHIRFIQTPPIVRGQEAFFSTYRNQHCPYEVVHMNSPIFFDQQMWELYSAEHSELTARRCEHQLI